MTEPQIITSTSNSTVKNICLLKQKKERDERGVFIIEGYKMLSEALSSGIIVQQIFAVQEQYDKNRQLFEDSKAECFIVSDAVMNKMTEWQTPQGIIAVVRKKNIVLSDVINGETRFLLVLDGVSDPGNIGTIIRTSEAAGIDAIITTQGTADCFQPKALRASMGSVFRVPIVEGERAEEIINILHQNRINVVSTSLSGKNLFDFDISKKKVALVFGNEANGIGSVFSDNADMLVKLPMCGKVESLNVAISAGIIMYILNSNK